ncbi:MAG TPA: ATP-binding protein [Phycisphaerae bacterium]|nr:ATP-binding protein [Phycisphaerae bacterium]HRR86121.1 ATP-binding protein [Phycisphaerae bacterium]
MIRRIEALNYRCLKYISQELDDFHVLVGPNASGKTTFLDVVAFLGDLVSGGLEQAMGGRTQNFQDLVWRRSGDRIELAVELEIPPERRGEADRAGHDRVRYEVAIGPDRETGALAILAEKVLLKQTPHRQSVQRFLFPVEPETPESLITGKIARSVKTVVNKVPGGNDNFYAETNKGWDHAFKLGPRKSALGNLPDDESKFPVASWLKGVLKEGIQRLVLNSAVMRKPSPPSLPSSFLPDGANLPWVIEGLRQQKADRHHEWVVHLQTALPDLTDVKTIVREEDRHRYLVACYRDGLEVPSWMVSDGTLRLMALTLLAYLPRLRGVYLIEEPENGIHPRAVEAVFQSLSGVYDAQVLLATHSPVILSIADSSEVLCFSKTESGATDVVRGTEHPKLRDWRGETNLGVLFAGGVLG